MLLAVLLQSAAAAGLGKLGAALGAAIAVIGAGIGIGKIGGSAWSNCPSAGGGRRYPYEYDYYRRVGRRCGPDRHYCLFINFVLIINLACHY